MYLKVWIGRQICSKLSAVLIDNQLRYCFAPKCCSEVQILEVPPVRAVSNVSISFKRHCSVWRLWTCTLWCLDLKTGCKNKGKIVKLQNTSRVKWKIQRSTDLIGLGRVVSAAIRRALCQPCVVVNPPFQDSGVFYELVLQLNQRPIARKSRIETIVLVTDWWWWELGCFVSRMYEDIVESSWYFLFGLRLAWWLIWWFWSWNNLFVLSRDCDQMWWRIWRWSIGFVQNRYCEAEKGTQLVLGIRKLIGCGYIECFFRFFLHSGDALDGFSNTASHCFITVRYNGTSSVEVW